MWPGAREPSLMTARTADCPDCPLLCACSAVGAGGGGEVSPHPAQLPGSRGPGRGDQTVLRPSSGSRETTVDSSLLPTGAGVARGAPVLARWEEALMPCGSGGGGSGGETCPSDPRLVHLKERHAAWRRASEPERNPVAVPTGSPHLGYMTKNSV